MLPARARPSAPLDVLIATLALAVATSTSPAAGATGLPPSLRDGVGAAAPLALSTSGPLGERVLAEGGLEMAGGGERGGDSTAHAGSPRQVGKAGGRTHLAAEVLRSFLLPGWGEWHQGHRDAGLAFLAIEAGLVGALTVSVGQGHLRRGSSERTAESFAGIDLTAHDDQFRKRVSDFRSSDEYNRLVVYREAANLYYGDIASYNAYIETHSLQGADAWAWESDQAWEQYRSQRRESQRAFQRARFAALGMVINAVASAVTSGYLAGRSHDRQAQSDGPDGGVALGGLAWTVEPAPGIGFQHRVAWVLRF